MSHEMEIFLFKIHYPTSTIKNRDLFYTMDEIIESTFFMYNRDSYTL